MRSSATNWSSLTADRSRRWTMCRGFPARWFWNNFVISKIRLRKRPYGRPDENRPVSSQLDRRRRDGDAGLAGVTGEVQGRGNRRRDAAGDWRRIGGTRLLRSDDRTPAQRERPRDARLAICPPTEERTIRFGRPLSKLVAECVRGPDGRNQASDRLCPRWPQHAAHRRVDSPAARRAESGARRVFAARQTLGV